MNTSLFIPFLNAVARNPDVPEYWIWYKGEKVRKIGNLKSTYVLGLQWCTEYPVKPRPAGTQPWMPEYYPRVVAIREVTLHSICPDGQVSDFQMGAEGDAQPLCFDYGFTVEEKQTAYRIFQDVFSGSWKNVGQWIYATKFPRLVAKRMHNFFTYKASRILKISYTPDDVSVDSHTRAPNTEHKYVFLADGKLFDIETKGAPFEVPVDLKIGDVRMAGIPLIWWLLVFGPETFVDTTTLPMAFKKMVKDQAESHPDTKNLWRNIWWMNGDVMAQVEVTNKWVRLNGAKLKNEEIQNLMDNNQNLWVGKYSVIRRLFANRSRSSDVSNDSTCETNK